MGCASQAIPPMSSSTPQLHLLPRNRTFECVADDFEDLASQLGV
jgi:hypothetical protein